VSLPEKIGRYEIVAALASGGMAEILLGRLLGPSGFESTVVIKRILPHLARLERFVDMFLDEARIVAQIRHPNVVFVQELGRDNKELFLVMEYLAGESAASLSRKLVMRSRLLEPHLAAHIVAEACAGLHAAHELVDPNGNKLSLVHRDVSPQNVFITYDGQVKVIDFGIAKAAGRIARTEAGQLKGKFDYMSPEQCHGSDVDRRADIFALGVVLYELSTGRRLFKRGSELATLKAITDEPIVPPSRVVEAYPESLEAVCMRALARDRANRYPTAADMRKELLRVAREQEPAHSGTPEEMGAALSGLMVDLFEDRVAAKREMLRKVRSGSAVTSVPAEEGDEPELSASGDDLRFMAGGGLGTEAGASLSTKASAAGPRKKRPLVALALGVGALAALGISALLVTVQRARTAPPIAAAALAVSTGAVVSPDVSQVASQGAVPPPPSGIASAAADPTPPPALSVDTTVTVHVESQPPAAHAFVSGADRGRTPIDIVVPRDNKPVELELHHSGYATVVQRLTPDADQKLFLVMPAERPATRRPRTPPPSPVPSTTASPSPRFRRFDSEP
jgi:hypothetical protein